MKRQGVRFRSWGRWIGYAVALLLFVYAPRVHAQSSPAPNQWAYLQDVATGHYMTATANGTLPGQLQLLPFDAQAHQLFQIEDQGGGLVALRSKLFPKRVITTSRTNYSSDAEYKQTGLILWLYDWVKGGNQTWYLEKIRKENKIDVVRIQNKFSGHFVGMDANGWLEHAVRDQAREWRVYSADDPPRPVGGAFKPMFVEPLGPTPSVGALMALPSGGVAIHEKKGFHLSSTESKDPSQHFILFPMHDGTTVFISADGTRSLRWEQGPNNQYKLSYGPIAFDSSRRFLRVAEPQDDAFAIEIPNTQQFLSMTSNDLKFAPKGIGVQTFGAVEARLHAVWTAGSEPIGYSNDLEPEVLQTFWTRSANAGNDALLTDVTQRVKWPDSTRVETKSVSRADPLAASASLTLGKPHHTVQPYHVPLFTNVSVRWSTGKTVIHWYRILGTKIPSGRSNFVFMTKTGLSRYATGGLELAVPSCRQVCWKGDSAPKDMLCVGYLCAKDEKELSTRLAFMGFAVAEFAINVATAGAALRSRLAAGRIAAAKTVRQIVAKRFREVGEEVARRSPGAVNGLELLNGPALSHAEEQVLARLGFVDGNLALAFLNEDPTGIFNLVRAFWLPSCGCDDMRPTPRPPSTEAQPAAYPYKLNTGTALQPSNTGFAFAVLPNGDLMAIMKSNTGSKSTEVHILTAASQYQKFSLHTKTALLETDDTFAFAALPNGDLMAIKKSKTGSKSTEVHILTAASQYQKFSVQTGTALQETDGTFAFAALANGDLMAIMKSGTGSKSTEVHILSAASQYKKFSLHTGTALQETDGTVAFAALPNRDLMVIKKSGTGSKSTEVHILTATSQYQQFRLHTGTALPETDDTVDFGALSGDRLVAIKKTNTGTRTTEVHVVGP